MSIIKFNLKNEHLMLLKHLRWFENNNKIISCLFDDIDENGNSEITHENKYEFIDLILNGRPSNIDPLTHEDIIEYSDEQKAEWDKLYSELPICLSIILTRGSFETGTFKTKWHDINWVKIG